MRVDTKQFERLVQQHQRTVFGIALRFLGNRGEAEEVAQDVFLALYNAMPGLKGDEHILYWLRRVAVHRSTDALRRRNGRPEGHAESWDEQVHGCCARQVSEGAMNSPIEALVRSLPEPYRTAIILRYTEDVEPDEIASLTAQPLATVKSQLQRGLRMLRRKAGVARKELSR